MERTIAAFLITLLFASSAHADLPTIGEILTNMGASAADEQQVLAGEFLTRDFAHLTQPKEGREVKWNEARLMVLNSESRALRAVDDFVVAGETAQVAADGYAGSAGISTVIPLAALREGRSIPFRVKLTLAGSSQLSFLPLARKAEIGITLARVVHCLEPAEALFKAHVLFPVLGEMLRFKDPRAALPQRATALEPVTG